jgi:formate hydrogenlyase transcriptional activator
MQGVAREPDSNLRPDDSGAQEPRKLEIVGRSSAEILLAMTDLIVGGGALPQLFQELVPLLRELTKCALAEFAVCDAARNCVVRSFWKTGMEVHPWDSSSSHAQDSPTGWVWEHQEPVRIPDAERETGFAKTVAELREHGVRSFMIVPMSTSRRRYGTLGIGHNELEPEASDTLVLLERAARLVALAVENHEIHGEWQKQQNRLQSLVEIGREVTSTLEFDQLLMIVFAKMQQITNYDYARLALLEPDSKTLRIRSVEPAQSSAARDWTRLPLAGAISARAIEGRTVMFLDAAEVSRLGSSSVKEMQEAGVRSLCCVPLLMGSRALGSLLLGATRENAFSREDGDYLQQVARQIAPAIHNASAYREVAQAKDRLAQEKRYLENEIHAEQQPENIVGNSPALRRVLDYAAIVANTDATVLITGETGTGKERIARAIHLMSSRRDRNFIKLNCAAIPTGLLESELFGHEKGAFTGAVSQKVGRLELADRGTLLLDEIGEIPLELQPKLLRVLQDQEFERLGGTKTIRVDARVLAASNRDLVLAVEQKEFRTDLFYRLNVFPLHLPSLRERREDIPLLIRYFVEKSAARMHKHITLIPDEAVEVMMNWRWPGNIRELENFIERSVILSDDERLRPPLSELREEIGKRQPDSERTLRERERDQIVAVLRETRGVLSGVKGAAARLGLKRTTLQHKMQKLGISRGDYLD